MIPITSEVLLTRPSDTPKITARSVPDWPVRCQRSLRPISPARRGTWTSRRAAGIGRRPSQADLPCAVEPAPDLGVLALVGRDRRDLGRGLPGVGVLLVALEGLDEVADGACPEDPGQADDQSGPEAGPGRAGGTVAPSSRSLPAQTSAWRRSLPAIVRKAAARRSLLLDPGQGVVQDDRVALELEVLEALLEVDRRPPIDGSRARPATGPSGALDSGR